LTRYNGKNAFLAPVFGGMLCSRLKGPASISWMCARKAGSRGGSASRARSPAERTRIKFVIFRFLPLSLVAMLLCVVSEARAVASAELYQNQAYTYGRFEARLRFAAGDGVISSFFLWKPGSEIAGTFWNELDFEKLGADCRLQTNPLYGAPVVDHSEIATVDGDLCGEYHTYTFEWTPTYIAYSVDGVEVRRDQGEAAEAFAVNASAGMQIHFNIWPGDATFGGNFDPAILPIQQYVAWVQYSSFAEGAFTLAWREEFDGPALPSGWAVGNWASPKNLSTHQPANVGFTAGFGVLSLTADDATGFAGMPPLDADPPGATDTGMGTSGGPGAGGGSPAQEPSASAEGGSAGEGGEATSPAPSPAAPNDDALASAAGASAISGATDRASDGGCSHAATSRARSSDGSTWLALCGAALVACRRSRRGRRRVDALARGR
jgi:endo-1,3-1,4-beta-glycanase ExoK